MRYIRTISFYNLSRLRTTNINKPNERKWFHTKQKQEVGETITNSVCADLAFPVNTFVEVKSR